MLDPMPQPNDLSQHLNKALDSYFAQHYREKCYVGLFFTQGKRKMVQINVPAHDLPILLQAKPSENNDPDSGKNRPVIPGHADEVKEYLLKRIKRNKPWILGTLTANIDPKRIELIELARGIGLVVIPRGVKLDITDGQHRKQAIHNLVESPYGELIGDNDFPITLVLEEDFNQCQSDFRDMAQSKALDKSLLLSFGEFEGRVGITKNLIKQVPMFTDKTETIKNSPSSKKKLIYTTNFIAQMVSCAFANNTTVELENIDIDQATNALVSSLNQFFSECSHTRPIFEIPIEYLTFEQVENFKEDCLLERYVGLEVLGRLLNSIYDKQNYQFDSIKTSQLSQLDWSRSGQLWSGNIVTIDPNPKNPAKPYKVSMSVNTIKIAVDTVKLHLGWIQPPPNPTLF